MRWFQFQQGKVVVLHFEKAVYGSKTALSEALGVHGQANGDEVVVNTASHGGRHLQHFCTVSRNLGRVRGGGGEEVRGGGRVWLERWECT